MGEPLRKRRRRYSVREKIAYLTDLENALLTGAVVSMREFADHYKIPRETLRKWSLPDLEEQEQAGRGGDRAVKERLVGHWPEVEQRLQQWVRNLRDNRLPVSVQDLQEQAMTIFEQWWDGLLDETRQGIIQCRPTRHDFHASSGWVELFMKRRRISLRKVTKNSTAIPADAAVRVQIFRDGVTGTIERFGIAMQFFFNMDQTFVLFDMRPMYTVNQTGEKDVDVRTSRANAKLGCTVTLCITATGGKLAAHVTFPRRGFVRQLAGLADDPPANIILTSSATGWVKEETLHHWLDAVFSPHVHDNNADQFLLILDQYRVHQTENFGMRVTEMGGILDFVPGGCTSLVQPLDVSVMKSFKSNVRKQWKNWKKDNSDENGQCERITLRNVANIVRDAWEAVNQQVVENGFEASFRPRQIDAGPLADIDEEEEQPGVEFVDVVEEEIIMDD